jgi:hypothetical protein
MARLTHQKMLLKYIMKKTERSIMNRMNILRHKINSSPKRFSLKVLYKNRRQSKIPIK